MLRAARGAGPPSRRRAPRSARGRAAGASSGGGVRWRRGRAATRWRSSRARRGACAARAGRAAARRAPPPPRTRSRAAHPRDRRAGEVGARADHPVAAGEEALHDVARGARTPRCGRRGGRTAAPPAGAPPGWTRTAPWASGRCPRSASASGAAPRSAALGRERLVHVHEVELAPAPGTPRSSATRRAAATPSRRGGTAGSGPTPSTLAQPSSANAASGSDRSVADPRPPLLDQRPRLRRRHHHDAVPAAAQLVGEPLDVCVHLVVLLPGVGRDLGDRERHDSERYMWRGLRAIGLRNEDGRPEGRPSLSTWILRTED